MAKFQLQEGEKLIGQSYMAYRNKQGLGYRQESGVLYVTDRRMVHQAMLGIQFANESISDIKGYQMGKLLGFIPMCTVHMKDGSKHIFADFRAKKVKTWLEAVGVKAL